MAEQDSLPYWVDGNRGPRLPTGSTDKFKTWLPYLFLSLGLEGE
jgi:hypothetical protein